MRWLILVTLWIAGSFLYPENLLALALTAALIYAAVTTKRT